MSSPATVTAYGKYMDLQNFLGSQPTSSGSLYLSGSDAEEKMYTNVDMSVPGLLLTGSSGLAGSSTEVNIVLDEDAMGSNDASALATQQSIKAYVDAQVGGADLDFAGDSGTGAVDLDSQTFTIAGSTGLDTTAGSQTLTIALDLNELSAVTPASGDQLACVDATDSSTGKMTVDNLANLFAGTVTSTGISDSSAVLTWDLQNWTASTTIANADLIGVDDGANGTLRKMTRANLLGSATAAFSNGMTATTGDFSGNVTIDGNATLGNAAADVVTSTGQLTASQGATFTGAVFCDSTIIVDGAAEFDGNVTLGDAATDVTTVTSQLTCSQGADFTKVTNHDAGLTSTTITGSGAATLKSLHSDSVNLDGGSIDGIIIGAASAAAGTFAALVGTSLNCSEGNITNVGNIALDTISADDGSSLSFSSNWTNAGRTVANLGIVTTVDINGGSVDGTTIGAASRSSIQCTTLNANGNVTLGNAAADVVTCTGQLTASQGADFGAGITVDAGGATITAGGLTVTAGAATFGTSGNGSDITFYGDEANNVLLWDVTENALIIKDGGTETVRMGGDATGDYAIDVGNGSAGSNNINKVRASAFVTFSDERLKSDVAPMRNALQTVNALKPVNFTWKSDGTRDFGFIAQNIKGVLPQAVHGTEEGLYGVDYGRLTTILVSAIQEQNIQLEELKNKMENK